MHIDTHVSEVTRDGDIVIAGASITFGQTKALSNVSLSFRRGEIHALLGQNGAGKSTLFKTLAGVYEPEPSLRVTVDGHDHAGPITPKQSQEMGFKFVHQDLALVETMTVAENVCAQKFLTSRGRIRWVETERRVAELLDSLGVQARPEAVVGDLPQAVKAGVAIARALYSVDGRKPSLLVLDEPTAHLPIAERDRLFESMRKAADLGAAVVFSTHRLDEVLALSERISVLRDGKLVWSDERQAVADEDDLITKILGQELNKFYPQREDSPGRGVRLAVQRLVGGNVDGISFDVHSGEILGLTGLIGAGHDQVPYMVMGATQVSDGSVEIDGRTGTLEGPPRASALGMALLPADRVRHSGVPTMTVRENLTMTTLHRFTTRGRLRRRHERTTSTEVLDRFEVRPPRASELPLSGLSGGNQQKVLLARSLIRDDLKVLILHEPTQGVDVGAKQALLKHIAAAAEMGVAVLLVSTDNEDLSNLCDRVLVMRHGRIQSELHRPSPDQIAEQTLSSA